MPGNFFLGRSPPFPLCNKEIKIIIGKPLEFDIPKMRQLAISMSRDLSFSSRGWPIIAPHMDWMKQRRDASTQLFQSKYKLPWRGCEVLVKVS